MRPEEATATKQVAIKAFGVFWHLIPAPEDAMVAILDGQIVGGFIYKIKTAGKKKTGMVSWFFTHPDVQGKGIGRQLGDAGLKQMWDEGCDVITTFVRDDNVASWIAFVKQGFVRGTVSALVGELGLSGFLNLAAYWFSPIHDFYIVKKDGKVKEKRNGPGQAAIFTLLNLLLLLLAVRNFSQDALRVAGSLLFVLVGGTLAGGIGALFSRERKWGVRMTTGGVGISLLVSVLLRNFFPVFAGWYPAQYEHTPKFKRDMALVAICSWLFYIAVIALVKVELLPAAAGIASMLLVIRCIPIASLGSHGGERVWQWSKPLFLVLTVASVLLMWLSGTLFFWV